MSTAGAAKTVNEICDGIKKFIAINHLSERRKVLLAKKSAIDEELAGLDAAILALE
jgi:hypothetical protein